MYMCTSHVIKDNGSKLQFRQKAGAILKCYRSVILALQDSLITQLKCLWWGHTHGWLLR